ncbi:MAG: TM0106 family RecB-like putative nuclease [Gemmatimonadaceae bacterium]
MTTLRPARIGEGCYMHLDGFSLCISATDLSRFLSCRHCTALDMAVARGKRERPFRHDPLLRILAERGAKHERSYVDSLIARGITIVDASDIEDFDHRALRTLEAMQAGVDAIVQGALRGAPWFGYPDVLQRVERPSSLGDWSYEVADTKLSRETRGGTILQLSLYSDMLATAQRSAAEFFHVVTPDAVQPVRTYRVADYAAYCRLVRARLHAGMDQDDAQLAAAHYPEPVEYCGVCHWLAGCSAKRRRDDHLSLVAGITRLQRRELADHSITTVSGVARLPSPLPFRPTRGSSEALEGVRHQAYLQLESRGRAVPLYELRTIEPGNGLLRLPEPSPGDVFLDLEGDPLAIEGGREYLFGVATLGAGEPRYLAWWALTDRDERRAFEAVLDFITVRWQAYPGMHIYHYAPYEPTALKRLMGRYVTREAELDRLLRAERFVDLYSLVRQSMQVGVERYSIKNLEPLYAFGRTVPLDQASRGLRVVEEALELGRAGDLADELRSVVEGYNRDDCLSTLRLRAWLEGIRSEVEARGSVLARPVPQEGDASQTVDERTRRVEALRTRLLAGVSDIPSERSEEQQGRWLLAYLLDCHRREDKAAWWEYFRLRDLSEEELLDEPQAVAGLQHVERVEVVLSKKGRRTGSVIDRYRFPPQEMELGREEELRVTDGSTLGRLVAVDRAGRTIDIRKGPSRAQEHPSAVFAYTYVATDVLENSIFAFAESVAEAGRLDVDSGPQYRAARELLLARAPRLRSGPFMPEPNELMLDFAERVVGDLADTVLAIQGPPGAGKTYCGARMICRLVSQGKKVGVTGDDEGRAGGNGGSHLRAALEVFAGFVGLSVPRTAARVHAMHSGSFNAGA